MAEQSNQRRDLTSSITELDATKRIQAFVDDHPLLSLAFMVAAGYAVGRIVSKL